jgi:replication factor C subunit 3/5
MERSGISDDNYVVQRNNFLPWIEKYRPQTFSNIISNEQNLIILKNMLKKGSLPHLLFHGTSGTGKTSTIMAFARELYQNNINLMVMKLDASDDRGINTVRDEIKGFAEKKNLFQKGVKLIILDEADSMTFDAQFALRRIIEKYSESTRFCLICNYENKIIPAIRSRCANFRFNPINKNDIINTLTEISKNENLNIIDNSLNIIADLSNGDLRKAINLLQSISMKSNNITPLICYETSGLPTKEEISTIYDNLNNIKLNFKEIYNNINHIIKNNGYSLDIVLKELTLKIIENGNLNNKAQILSDLSDLENKITKSIFTDIYISALIAIFIKKNL